MLLHITITARYICGTGEVCTDWSTCKSYSDYELTTTVVCISSHYITSESTASCIAK
ncbi:hypothetical protein GCM10008022_24760 [Paenibacillus hunanensis]|nr:hypothetical protein GCM10008022_24760 [Paenibacillus hunanensis]